MKALTFAAALVTGAALLTSGAYAGVATSGGIPEVLVVSCGNSVSGSIGMNLSLYVTDTRLTVEPVLIAAEASVASDSVHFKARQPGPDVDLAVETEPSADGIFHGVLSYGEQAVSVECTYLAEHYRPLADQTIDLQYRVTGSRCWANGLCGGFVGSLIPKDFAVTLHFMDGALRGTWSVEEDAFGQTMVIDVAITKYRDKPATYAIKVAPKGAVNPTSLTLKQNRLPEVSLETPLSTANIGDKASFNVTLSAKK